MSVPIQGVRQGSICDGLGIHAGDILVSVNGNRIADVLDFQYYIAETVLRIVFQKPDQCYYAFKIKKEQYEDIGLEFDSYLMDQQRSCTNHCIFCFVDQMPPGMRETLYFKDDDARLSFLLGNYITLTNLKQEEVDRIIQMKISPINVSVHTTNPELRCRMMKNRFAGDRLDYLRQICDAGIDVNCQLVLCPGINDGGELERTLQDLGALYPAIRSLACVPVGITKFRKGLFPLEQYGRESARRVIDQINAFADAFYQKHGTRLAYASDEFYIRAGRELPEDDFYEDFAQLENGVGVIAQLRTDFESAYYSLPADDRKRSCSIATGTDAAPFIQELVEKAQEKWQNLSVKVYAVRNEFFGETITVAGLVTATDIIKQLKGQELGDMLILPDCMLRHERDKFLDDLTVADVEQGLGIPVKLVGTEGDALLYGLLEA